MNHIYPTLSYRDADAAAAFLTDALGFQEHSVHRSDEGKIVHAEMRFGDGMIMFGDAGEGEADVRVGVAATYVTVDDADAHHDRAKSAGAEIVMELRDTDYGSRDYALLDPEGNRWYFGTYDPLNG
ncbi:MAG: VOC family protein [Thermoleophilaceae bacterium]|nr:VOC family protein [Thermoleophilaceae bacterium]